MIEHLLKRDSLLVASSLGLLTALSWAWVLLGAGTGMSTLAMTTFQFPPPVMDGVAMSWTPHYALIMLAMWWIMMIAMMIPSAAPMILLYARVARHAQTRGQIPAGTLPTATFVSGYLAAWFAFSALATAAQWLLEKAGLLHAMLMWSTSTTLTGALLLAAGLFQLTPLKKACLEHCRAPADYLSRHWRNGHGGAFRMGAVHGTYCLGCCWALMALLFAGGIMNLVWIAGLTILVLIEKVVPWGARMGQVLAGLLCVSGLWLLAQGLN